MGQDVAARIRNFIIVVTLVSFCIIVGLFLVFASRMVDTQTQDQLSNLPQIIMRSQLDAFLKQNYGTMRTTVDALTENSSEYGILYMGMMDDNGRMHTRGISNELNETLTTEIEDNYLTSIEENVIIGQTQSFQLSNGLSVTEVLVPVRRSEDDQTYGAIKIGFNRPAFYGNWPTLRNRVIFTSVLFILFFVILILVYSQRWRNDIENLLTKEENKIRNEYESKIDEMEEQSSEGPLSSDEFFQIIDFGKKLPESMEPESVLRYLVNATVRILNVKQVVIFLLSPEDSSVLIGQMGMKDGDWMDRDRLQKIEIDVGSGEIGTIAELGQTNILDKPSPGAGVAGALRSGGQTIGVLRATEKKTGARMGNKDKLKVRLICQLSGEVISNAFEHQKLKETADT